MIRTPICSTFSDWTLIDWEHLLYNQPFLIRAGKNIYAFVADVVVLIVSLPICVILDKQAKKMIPN